MEDDLARIDRLVRNGVPVEALAFYGRWWQFETWLRDAVYVELRAKYGTKWTTHLGAGAPTRAERDAINAYMASADAGDVLAYLDAFDLFRLIDEHWQLFEPSLLPRTRWTGLVDGLRPIRNRIAHCRRPHGDDVERIEQALRDLELGARRFFGSYVRTHSVSRFSRDPVVRAWQAGKHDDARRLLDHAVRQYDVRFELSASVRPWAALPDGKTLSGTEGALWHARWWSGEGEIEPRGLWEGLSGYVGVTDLLVHVLHSSPWQMEITFAAVDDPPAVADAVGNCFDALLVHGRRRRIGTDLGLDAAEKKYERWRREGAELPARVQVASLLADFDTDAPYTIFGASRAQGLSQ